MADLFEQTKKKYHGKMAKGYEAKRKKQERWDKENELVRHYLDGAKGPVLDVPVGTGRFLDMLEDLGHRVWGVDSSEEMLRLARRKRGAKNATFAVGDATAMRHFRNRQFGTVLSIRFLDLIPEEAMKYAVKEICRVAKQRVILTIRLGEKYVLKSNTCTHDRKKFYRLIKTLGWQIHHETPIFGKGWEVMCLIPVEK